MKKIIFALTVLLTFTLNAQEWSSNNDPFGKKAFIENFGQYNSYLPDNNSNLSVKFYNPNDKIFYYNQGCVFMLDTIILLDEDEEEYEKEEGEEELKFRMESSYVTMKWLNSNENPEIISNNKTSYYYTYGTEGYWDIKAKCYKQIVYKNLYQGIDVEYNIDERGGVEYRLIVQAGADLSQVKMQYTGDFSNIVLDNNEIKIITKNGKIQEKELVSFYKNEEQNKIETLFNLENNIITFNFPNGYDNTKTLIIDPWTSTPFNGSEVYDVDFDEAGNVYAMGEHTYSRPHKIAKYNSSGSLTWTYNYPSTNSSPSVDYFGAYSEGVVIRNTGFLFVGTSLVSDMTGAYAVKINPDGSQAVTSPQITGSSEIWQMRYNACIEKLYGFGGGVSSNAGGGNMIIFSGFDLTAGVVHNFNGLMNFTNDIASIVMDDNGDIYTVASSSDGMPPDDIQKSLFSNGYSSVAWSVSNGYNFNEISQSGGGMTYNFSVHSNTLAINKDYLYSYDGNTLKAWNKASGALLGSVVVDGSYSGGADRINEGIDVDDCNNVYVGGDSKVHVYSFNGSSFSSVQTMTTNISDRVYDIAVDRVNNLLIAGGEGFITVLNAIDCENPMIVTTSTDCGPMSCSVDNVTGGNPPYSYLWSYNNATTSSIVGVPQGTYYVTITDSSCFYPHVIIDTLILSCGDLNVTVNSETICEGESTTITATPDPADLGTYTYTWSESTMSGASNSVSPTTTTTYTVTVSDGTNTATASGVVTVNANPTSTITHTDVCPNATNGSIDLTMSSSIDLTMSSGASPYNFDWDNDGTGDNDDTEDLSNLGVGTYNVTITDDNGCTTTNTATIINLPEPTSSVISTNICSGGTDGAVDITVTGGTSPYNFDWDNDGTGDNDDSEDLSNLGVGDYNVTVTDNNGCTTTASGSVANYPSPTSTITHTDITCYGLTDGTIDLTVLDGTSPYTFQWDNDGTTDNDDTEDLSGLGVGDYNVTIYDTHGCTATNNASISQPAEITGTDDAEICNGQTYTFGTQTLTTAGQYTETFTALNGCDSTVTLTLNIVSTLYNTVDTFLCDNTPFTTNQNTYTTSGTYTENYTSIGGCDSIVTYNVEISPIITNSINATICDGDNYVLGTQTCTTSGQFTEVFVAANGCDSTVTLDLIVNPVYDITQDTAVCEGESVTYPDGVTEVISATTSHISNLQTINSCDSIITTNVIMNPVYNIEETVNVCENESVTFPDGTTEVITSSVDHTSNLSTIASCDSIIITHVNMHLNPNPQILGDLDICEDESTNLSLSETYSSYLWSTGSASPTITVNTTSVIDVAVSTSFGCNGNTSVNVTVNPNPTPVITGDSYFCSGSTATISADAGYASYLWNTNASTQSINVSNGGDYTVVVTDDHSCMGTATFNVFEDIISLEALGSTLICAGVYTDIFANISGGIPPYTYNWSNGVTTANQTINPYTDVTYTVWGQDGYGCQTNVDNISIQVSQGVNFEVYSNKDTICPGDPLLVTDLIENGMPPYTIYDENGDVVTLNHVIYPEQAGVFPYTIIDGCNSTDTSNLIINFYPIPTLMLQADTLRGCPPLTVHFNENNISGSGYSYQWSFDDFNENNLSLSSNPVHIFKTAGYYDITLSVTTADGCKVKETVVDMINVYHLPIAKFDALPDVMTILDPTFDFDNYSEMAASYIWNFDDGDSSNLFEPTHIYNNSGYYNVELVAVSEEGCRDTTEHIVRVKEIFTIYGPTAFSPDGDNINDGFCIVGTGIDTDNFTLIIYDRWGEIIWQTNDLFAKWKGFVKEGKKAPVGTYVWKVQCKDFEGVEHEKAGTVTLIR